MVEQRLVNPAAIDNRVDFGQKRATSGRRAAAEIHRPDSVAPTAQNITKKSNDLTRGRAVRAPIAASPQKLGGRYPTAIDDRVDFGQKRARNGRRAAAEVHRPDGVEPAAAQIVINKSKEPIGGRAVRAPTASSPQKLGD